MRHRIILVLIAIVVATLAPIGAQQNGGRFDERLLQAFTYRNLGPWRMQVRVADVEVPASPLKDRQPAPAAVDRPGRSLGGDQP
jgi:hypothetical protein